MRLAIVTLCLASTFVQAPTAADSHQPIAMERILPSPGGAVFVGSDSQRLIAVEFKADRDPAFRVLSEAEARPWTAGIHTSVATEGFDKRRVLFIERDNASPPEDLPPLPQTTYDQFAAARPQRVRDGYVLGVTEVQESIGPWQRDNGRIWFGKSFYDGEGTTGVGGFGYFDLKERKLHLFSPPEIADWSVSAMVVDPSTVWMTLVHRGETSGSSGGLLRYDRQSGALRRLDFPDIGIRLIQVDGKTVAATDSGLAVVEGDRVKRYFIDRTTDGRVRVAVAKP